MNKNSEKFALGLFVVLMVSTLLAMFVSVTNFANGKKDQIVGLTPNNNNTIESEQINYLLNTVALGEWERVLLLTIAILMIAVCASIVMAIWAGTTANNMPKSYILLTKESQKDKEKTLQKTRFQSWSFISSIIVSVLFGVAGNICYALWFEDIIKAF